MTISGPSPSYKHATPSTPPNSIATYNSVMHLRLITPGTSLPEFSPSEAQVLMGNLGRDGGLGGGGLEDIPILS